ncbi:MAG: DUF547 domain-containing protein [Chloroflexaceae bacterium]
MNELLALREAALSLVTGTRPGEALNLPPPASHSPAGPELADRLAAAVRALKIAAASDDGLAVDYAALRDSAAYAEYVERVTPLLFTFDPSLLATRGARLAFWINLYNGLILDGVVAYGVRRSVRGGLGGLGFFRRAAYIVGGYRLCADDIEHGILRANAGNPFLPGPQFADDDARLAWTISPLEPRVHFALNCASRSCPPIAVYDGARIEAQLDLAARSFVGADTDLDPRTGTLLVSSIFKWYQADFGGLEGVLRFIRAHLSPDDERRRWIEAQAEVALAFKPYDWSLNSRF